MPPVHAQPVKKSVIASQCAPRSKCPWGTDWRGNPFSKCTIFAFSCEFAAKRLRIPSRFAPQSKCPWVLLGMTEWFFGKLQCPPLSGRAALRAAFPPRQLAAFSPRGTAQAKSPPFPPVRGPAAAPLLTQHKKKKCSHRLTGAQNVGTIYLVNYEIWGNCHGSKSKKGIRQ